MNEKYLPIGSIITTKKSSQKIMIVGYFGLEYTEAIEVYDYMGCTYPKGLLEKIEEYDLLNEDGIIVCEIEEEFKTTYKIKKEKKYGNKKVYVLTNN